MASTIDPSRTSEEAPPCPAGELSQWLVDRVAQPLRGWELWGPGGGALDDGIGEDDELSGAGDEGEFVGFAAGGEAAVEGDKGGVPAEGGGQGGGIEGAAQALAAAGDVAFAAMFAAVVIEGGQTGQGGGLFAADGADLGHANEDGQCGALADAGDAGDQVETPREVGVSAQGLRDALQLGGFAAGQPLDVAGNDPAQPRRGGFLQAGFGADELVFDLLDKGEGVGERLDAGIAAGVWRLEQADAGGDQLGIEPIV